MVESISQKLTIPEITISPDAIHFGHGHLHCTWAEGCCKYCPHYYYIWCWKMYRLNMQWLLLSSKALLHHQTATKTCIKQIFPGGFRDEEWYHVQEIANIGDGEINISLSIIYSSFGNHSWYRGPHSASKTCTMPSCHSSLYARGRAGP